MHIMLIDVHIHVISLMLRDVNWTDLVDLACPDGLFFWTVLVEI